MINIQDNIHALTGEQIQALQTKSLAYPFDIYLQVGADSKAQLQSDVSAKVTGLKVLSVGVDPAHHFTYVRGSTDLALPDGPEVASTGNAYFRRADLVGGVDAIAAKAKELAATTRTVETAAGTPIVVHEEPMASGWWWGLGGIGAIFAVVCAWVWLSRRKLEDERARFRSLNAELNNELGDAKIENAERGELAAFDRKLSAPRRVRWTPPPSSAPMLPTVTVSTSNDLATGILIGELLAPAPDPIVVYAEPSSYSSYNAPEPSSSSSSWSDSSSSSSYDGGSSSDFSGGFDSGSSGGGSDW